MNFIFITRFSINFAKTHIFDSLADIVIVILFPAIPPAGAAAVELFSSSSSESEDEEVEQRPRSITDLSRAH